MTHLNNCVVRLIDGGGSNIFCVFVIYSFDYWSSWGLVGLDSLHGFACSGRILQVKVYNARKVFIH